MKETPMWRITVTSSLDELSTDKLRNRKGMKMEVLLHPPPTSFCGRLRGWIFKDDVNGFSSASYLLHGRKA
jgi:hypothetical protein